MIKTKIVLIGDVCIDNNISKGINYSSWGSPALHMAQYFGQQEHVETTVVSAHGPDFEQYASLFPIYPTKPRLKKTIIFENDQRGGKRLQSCHFSDQDTTVPIDDKYKTLIGKADAIVFCPILPHLYLEYVKKVIDLAPKNCLKVLLPQGYLRTVNSQHEVIFSKYHELDQLIEHFDIVILSDQDSPNALVQAYKWSVKALQSKIIVTQAAAGATIVAGGQSEPVPTKAINPNKVLDSVGCGDVFSAAALEEYYQSKNITNAVAAGNRAAGVYLKSKALSL
jgi:bifunctional ADP-heptose synthase (sugar kinase/adenylyltransferase)